jgi:hypothetical protein
VPDTLQSLELLGVELNVDPAYFMVTDLDVQEPEALETTSGSSQPLYRWLSEYDGN